MMAIVVICKKCHGTGKVDKFIMKIFRVKAKCSHCKGKGKRDISSTNPSHHI